MEDDLKKMKNERQPKKKYKTTSKKMEDDLKQKNGRQPKKKWNERRPQKKSVLDSSQI